MDKDEGEHTNKDKDEDNVEQAPRVITVLLAKSSVLEESFANDNYCGGEVKTSFFTKLYLAGTYYLVTGSVFP